MEDREDSSQETVHPLVLVRNNLEDQFVSLEIDGSSLMGLFEVDPEACVRSLDSPYHWGHCSQEAAEDSWEWLY